MKRQARAVWERQIFLERVLCVRMGGWKTAVGGGDGCGEYLGARSEGHLLDIYISHI